MNTLTPASTEDRQTLNRRWNTTTNGRRGHLFRNRRPTGINYRPNTGEPQPVSIGHWNDTNGRSQRQTHLPKIENLVWWFLVQRTIAWFKLNYTTVVSNRKEAKPKFWNLRRRRVLNITNVENTYSDFCQFSKTKNTTFPNNPSQNFRHKTES